ncbi:hypothetical protein ACMV8I_18825 [Ewingella sp. S1.OA.A_B6]
MNIEITCRGEVKSKHGVRPYETSVTVESVDSIRFDNEPGVLDWINDDAIAEYLRGRGFSVSIPEEKAA